MEKEWTDRPLGLRHESRTVDDGCDGISDDASPRDIEKLLGVLGEPYAGCGIDRPKRGMVECRTLLSLSKIISWGV